MNRILRSTVILILIFSMFIPVLFCTSNPVDNHSIKAMTGTVYQQPPPVVVLDQSISSAILQAWDTVWINWTSYNGVAPLTVSLEYSINGITGDWIPIKSGLSANGSYLWTLPSVVSYNCYVQATVTDSIGEHYSDWNSDPFQIWQSTTKGLFEGKVVDSSNHSVANARVLIVELNIDVYTSANGSFSIVLPLDTYTVEVSKSGYSTNKTGMIVAGFGYTPTFYYIELNEEGKITPTVLAGIVLFIVFVAFSLVVFYSIHRKRMSKYYSKRSKQESALSDDEGLEDADKYWDETEKKDDNAGPDKKNRANLKQKMKKTSPV